MQEEEEMQKYSSTAIYSTRREKKNIHTHIYIYRRVMTHVNETQGSVQKHSTRWCDVDRKIAQASFLFRSRRFIIIFTVVAICHFITFFHGVFNRVRLSIERKNARLTSSRVAKQRLRMIQREINRCCTLPWSYDGKISIVKIYRVSIFFFFFQEFVLKIWKDNFQMTMIIHFENLQ